MLQRAEKKVKCKNYDNCGYRKLYNSKVKKKKYSLTLVETGCFRFVCNTKTEEYIYGVRVT